LQVFLRKKEKNRCKTFCAFFVWFAQKKIVFSPCAEKKKKGKKFKKEKGKCVYNGEKVCYTIYNV